MRSQHSVLVASAGLLALVGVCAAGDSAPRPGGKDTPRFEPASCSIIASVGDSVAWKRYDVIPETRFYVAPSYTVRYYVEHIGEGPILTYEDSGRRPADDQATILEDGTILLWRRDQPESLDRKSVV